MELPPPPIRKCGLCDHVISMASNARCGFASATDDDGQEIYLCHADDHDCYHRWTVYGARPGDKQGEWRIAVNESERHHEIFVTDGTRFGEGLWFGKKTKQSLWKRFKNLVTRKGSTAKYVEFTDEDLDKVGRYLADKYGLEWKPIVR